MDQLQILETIKQKYLLPTDETVVLLHAFFKDSRKKFRHISNWCDEHHWKFVPYNDIMGSEASVVILYECNDDTELYSRAKNCLIIVHK